MDIGPRMEQLCCILHNMGGESRTQRELYLGLDYRGMSSNAFGSRVLDRCYEHGLMIGERVKGTNAIRVKLTEKGREVVETDLCEEE